MVALTYGDARVVAPESKQAATKAPSKNLFTRFLAAMQESRMRQAEREIALYAPHLRPEFSENGKTNTQLGGW